MWDSVSPRLLKSLGLHPIPFASLLAEEEREIPEIQCRLQQVEWQLP